MSELRETTIDPEPSGLAWGLLRVAECVAAHPEIEAMLREGYHPVGHVDTRDELYQIMQWAHAGGVAVTRTVDGIAIRINDKVSVRVIAPDEVLAEVPEGVAT